VRHRGQHGLLRDDDADPDHDDDGGVAEGEEVPERERSRLVRTLTFVHHLAGGVVDGRDVVGVERVAQAQGVGGDAQADAEELVVGGQYVDDEDQEPQRVQRQDRAVHPERAAALDRAHEMEGLPDHPAHVHAALRCHALRGHASTPRSPSAAGPAPARTLAQLHICRKYSYLAISASASASRCPGDEDSPSFGDHGSDAGPGLWTGPAGTLAVQRDSTRPSRQ
jgi:hypothetical protein